MRQTIDLVSSAVLAAGAAVEVANFNLRRRQMQHVMAMGAGDKAAEGDSDGETEYDSAGSVSDWDCASSYSYGGASDSSPSQRKPVSLAAARSMHKERTWTGSKTVWKQNVLERIDEMRKAMAN